MSTADILLQLYAFQEKINAELAKIFEQESFFYSPRTKSEFVESWASAARDIAEAIAIMEKR